ncbi:MAG: putative Tic20 family protein, partial [Pseudohongiellaceae bacterium]
QSEFVDLHGRNAINFQIMMALLALGSWLLVPFLVGIPLVVAVYVIAGGFAVVAALKAAAGRSYDYPVGVNMVQADSFRS